jgi:predicted ester cyclase
MEGTHQAPFQGIPATGKHVHIEAIAIFRVEHEKITEIWLNADFLGLFQQLGVVPLPGEGAT